MIDLSKEIADAAEIVAAPDSNTIIEMLKRFIDEGATTISFGVLMDADDDMTLGEAVNAYVSKVKGGAE